MTYAPAALLRRVASGACGCAGRRWALAVTYSMSGVTVRAEVRSP